MQNRKESVASDTRIFFNFSNKCDCVTFKIKKKLTKPNKSDEKGKKITKTLMLMRN